MFKRTLSALLAAMMLASMLAACSDSSDTKQPSNDTTAAIGEAVTTAPAETEPV